MVWSKARGWIGFRSAVPGIALLLMITLGLFLFAASSAFASGGTCPTGPNYGDSFNQTLSAIGITSCFYASKSTGSDSNSGTDEAHPWAHLPGMAGCTSNCASTTPAAGEGFIMRGGDTWTGSDLGIEMDHSGTSSNPIYYGVDLTWYSGGSWSRPIWSCASTAPYCGGTGNGQKSFWFTTASNVIVDNIEITGYQTSGGGGGNMFYTYQGAVNYSRLYIHGWSHSPSGDSDNGNVFGGGNGGSIAGTCIHDSVIDGADTTGDMLSVFQGTAPCVYNNYVSSVSNGFQGNGDYWANNYVTKLGSCFSGGCHQNAMFNFGPAYATSMLLYNNVITGNLCSVCGGASKLWLSGNSQNSATGYGFNNVVYNNSTGNMINLAGHNAGSYGTWYFFNNTVECGTDANAPGPCSANDPASPESITVYFSNNHWILTSGSAVNCTNNATCPETTDLPQSVSTASGQGYTSGSTYAFQPINGSGSTVGAGTNKQSVCTTISQLSPAGISPALVTAAYNACRYDTGYSCSYNTSNHTVNCPDRTTNGRPASGAPDIGSYQYGDPPNPPTGLSAVVN